MADKKIPMDGFDFDLIYPFDKKNTNWDAAHVVQERRYREDGASPPRNEGARRTKDLQASGRASSGSRRSAGTDNNSRNGSGRNGSRSTAGIDSNARSNAGDRSDNRTRSNAGGRSGTRDVSGNRSGNGSRSNAANRNGTRTIRGNSNRQRADVRNGDRWAKEKGKRGKLNIRGLLILAGLGLGTLLVVGLFLYLVIGALFSDSGGSENPVQQIETAIPTESAMHRAEELVQQADLLAAGYDYDAAAAKLQEFGADWDQQDVLRAARERYIQAQALVMPWDDTVPQIAFSSLVVDAARAFDGDEAAAGYEKESVTISEFRNILQSLYDRGYVLVRMSDVGSDIYLPEEKTPLILVQEDTGNVIDRADGDGDGVADATGDGFASRIVVGTDGYPTCEYTDQAGMTTTGAYDLIPVVEAFVQSHPDFSYRGARGVIGATGQQGVFGYLTHPQWDSTLGEEAYMEEIRNAQAVAECLRTHGWELACNGYGGLSYEIASLDELSADIQKWKNQVQPLIGNTDILLFPNGLDFAADGEYSGDKFDALHSAGFRYFCNAVGGEPYVGTDYVRQSGIKVTRDGMENNAEVYADFFDANRILDREGM